MRAMRDARRMRREQRDLGLVEMHGVHCDQVRPEQAEPTQSLEGAAAVALDALRHLLRGLVHMDVNRQAEFARERRYPPKGFVANRIGRMRCERESDLRIVEPAVAHRQAL